jgi:hypothetical protein
MSVKASALAPVTSAVWFSLALVGLLLGVRPAAAYEWHIETVDTAGWVGKCTSLALDGSGYPHISYLDDTNGDLKYAYRDASGWHLMKVGTGVMEPFGGHGSLALGTDGLPHASYFSLDQSCPGLRYARAEVPVASEEPSGSVIQRGVRLLALTPNPANTETNILYSRGDGVGSPTSPGHVRVFNRRGRLVAVPRLPTPVAGTYSIPWDLTSLDGRPVAPGVYYLRSEAETSQWSDVKRLVVIR